MGDKFSKVWRRRNDVAKYTYVVKLIMTNENSTSIEVNSYCQVAFLLVRSFRSGSVRIWTHSTSRNHFHRDMNHILPLVRFLRPTLKAESRVGRPKQAGVSNKRFPEIDNNCVVYPISTKYHLATGIFSRKRNPARSLDSVELLTSRKSIRNDYCTERSILWEEETFTGMKSRYFMAYIN